MIRTHRQSVSVIAFVLLITALAVGQALLQEKAEAQRAAAKGYALAATEGEHRIRNGGNLYVKVDPTKGSDNLALGTQQVPAKAGIPIHQHAKMDEVFYVLEGSGFFVLNDERIPVEKGSVAFIPKGSWHGFENPNGELLLLWAVSPPGLEGFFREVATPPGVPPRVLTRDELRAIARKYDMEFR